MLGLISSNIYLFSTLQVFDFFLFFISSRYVRNCLWDSRLAGLYREYLKIAESISAARVRARASFARAYIASSRYAHAYRDV